MGQPLPRPTDIEALLRQVLDGQARIERALAELRSSAAATVSAGDAAVLALVLPAMAEGIGDRGRVFSTSEACAALEPEAAADLFALLGDSPQRRLGKVFSRALGRLVCDGSLVLQRAGADRGVALWQIVRVGFAGFQTLQNPHCR